jgi:hypothetical protein
MHVFEDVRQYYNVECLSIQITVSRIEIVDSALSPSSGLEGAWINVGTADLALGLAAFYLAAHPSVVATIVQYGRTVTDGIENKAQLDFLVAKQVPSKVRRCFSCLGVRRIVLHKATSKCTWTMDQKDEETWANILSLEYTSSLFLSDYPGM